MWSNCKTKNNIHFNSEHTEIHAHNNQQTPSVQPEEPALEPKIESEM